MAVLDGGFWLVADAMHINIAGNKLEWKKSCPACPSIAGKQFAPHWILQEMIPGLKV
jgi:hypothetical protein